jgi:hypothetical protein
MSLRSNAGPMVEGYSGKIHKGCKSREAAIRTWNNTCLMHHKHIRPQVNIARAAHPPAPPPPSTTASSVQRCESWVSVDVPSTRSPSSPVSTGTSKPDEIPPLLPVEGDEDDGTISACQRMASLTLGSRERGRMAYTPSGVSFPASSPTCRKGEVGPSSPVPPKSPTRHRAEARPSLPASPSKFYVVRGTASQAFSSR